MTNTLNSWQPIETAPKDGFHILLFRPNITFVGYWATKADCWCVNAPGLPKLGAPTHWMPLPQPPASDSVSGAQKPNEKVSP